MPVTLTIKQVPDELAARLRAIAARNHRSLQGELMRILEATAALHETAKAGAAGHQLPAAEADASAGQPAAQAADELLSGLDAIVAGSHWGEAPLLPREQANDRSLTREFEHLAQEREAGYRR
jgi:plasmid stability protein